jgi:tellurite resistance protein
MAFDIRSKYQAIASQGPDPEEQSRFVAELALWSALGDEELQRDELEGIVEVVMQLPGFDGFSPDKAIAMLDEMSSKYPDAEQISNRIVELATGIVHPELRKLSYQLAALTASSDGSFSDEETDFLEMLQSVFELEDDEAEALIDEVFSAVES